MKTICIYDDDEKMVEKMSHLVLEIFPDIQIVEDPHVACELYLLDIEAPENGIDLAKYIMRMHHEAHIIFVTSHDELIFEALDTFPYYFVRKTELNKLKYALCKLKEENQEICVNIPGSHEKMSLPMHTIIMIEKSGSYCLIHSTQDYKVRCSLADLKQELHSCFVQVNQSVIINALKVVDIKGDEVFLSQCFKAYMSRRFRQVALKQILLAKEG